MSEPFSVRKEVLVKEDGRIVILYSFERALTPIPSLKVEEGREADKSQQESNAI